MQTFWIDDDPRNTAKVLDWRRLGKQRVEVLQILRALAGETMGWRHHSLTRAWAGHVNALVVYGEAICLEWRQRCRKPCDREVCAGDCSRDSCLSKIRAYANGGPVVWPGWVDDPLIRLAYRAKLLRKKPEHYGRLWPGVPADFEWRFVTKTQQR
jgi:hypothetical protein